MKMSAERLLQANVGDTNSLLSTPKCQHIENPISQVYIPKTDIRNIAVHLQVSIPRNHIDIGPALHTSHNQCGFSE